MFLLYAKILLTYKCKHNKKKYSRKILRKWGGSIIKIGDESGEKRNRKIVAIVILTILLLGTLGYIAYDKLYLKEETNNETGNNSNMGNGNDIEDEEKIDSTKALVYSILEKNLHCVNSEFYEIEMDFKW